METSNGMEKIVSLSNPSTTTLRVGYGAGRRSLSWL